MGVGKKTVENLADDEGILAEMHIMPGIRVGMALGEAIVEQGQQNVEVLADVVKNNKGVLNKAQGLIKDANEGPLPWYAFGLMGKIYNILCD